ncbi:MAG: PLDc N-terminal domain-containing protein [Phycisphaeraceae bacterium]
MQSDATPYVMFGFMALMMLVGLAVVVVSLVIWIWALVDAVRNPNLDDNTRLVWVLVIIFTQIIGAIIYLVVGRSGPPRR